MMKNLLFRKTAYNNWAWA